MTAAQEYDSVRSTADTESVYDGRTIPAGMEGAVLDAKPDGSILAEFAFAPQTADSLPELERTSREKSMPGNRWPCPNASGFKAKWLSVGSALGCTA